MPPSRPMTAVFVDFRHKYKQGKAHFIFEVPAEQADAFLYNLGGLPQADISRHVAITALADDPDDFLEKNTGNEDGQP